MIVTFLKSVARLLLARLRSGPRAGRLAGLGARLAAYPIAVRVGGPPLALVSLLLLVLSVSLSLPGCAPTWNWREIRVEAHGWAALMPDKPARFTRELDLVGLPVTMSMQGAEVEGATFTVAMVQLPDDHPATRERAVASLRAGMMRSVNGSEVSAREVALPVAGTAWRTEVRGEVVLDGRRQPVVQYAGFAAYGARAWQWVVVGPDPDREAVQTFLDGFRLTVPAP